MLLKNKLLIFVIIALLASPIVSAEVCTETEVLGCLRAGLYNFFINSQYDAADLRDLLSFYLNDMTITGNCAQQGSETGKTMTEIMAGIDCTDVPTCTDGTIFGECSSTQPLYCYGGELVINCDLCSCGGFLCDPNAGCTTTDIECGVGSDCGTDDYGEDYICQNGNSYRKYYVWSCMNPNTLSSSCLPYSGINVLDEICTNLCADGYCICEIPGFCQVGIELGACEEFVGPIMRCISKTNMVSGSDFSTTSAWIAGAGWTFNPNCGGGYYQCAEWRGPPEGYLEQNIGAEAGKTYKLEYTIVYISPDVKIQPSIGGQNGTQTYVEGSATGVFHDIITAINTGNLTFYPTGSGAGSDDYIYLDNVFVYKVLAQP